MHALISYAARFRALLLHPDAPVALLAALMALMPAVGMPNELVLQDTLKSALVAFAALGAALLWACQPRQQTVALHGLLLVPLVLALYALCSMHWSHAYLAGVEAVRWGVLGWLLWVALNTVTQRNLGLLLWGIHAGVVLASVWVLLQFWWDFGWFPQGASPGSSFVNRNFFAEYAVCALPFSVFALARMRRANGQVLMVLTLAVMVVAVLMTGMRAGLLALALLAPALVWVLWRFRGQLAWSQGAGAQPLRLAALLLALVGLLGALPCGSPSILAQERGTTALERGIFRAQSVGQEQEYTEGSFAIRTRMWKATARMLMAYPWTGVGAGAWEVEIPRFHQGKLEIDYFPHNEALQLLSEYGVVLGGLALAWLLAYGLHSVAITWHLPLSQGGRAFCSVSPARYAGSSLTCAECPAALALDPSDSCDAARWQEAPLRAFALCSLLALAVVGNAGFPLHLAGCGALFALSLAILAGSDLRLGLHQTVPACAHGWPPLAWRALQGLLLVSLGLAVYLSVQAVRTESRLVRAMQQLNALRLPASSPQSQGGDSAERARRLAQVLQWVHEAVAINPHYRKLTGEISEPFAASGDWATAVWILQTIAESRPNVAAVWTGLAVGNAYLGQQAQARIALQQVQRLRPDDLATRTLEVIVLSSAGEDERCARLLNQYMDQGAFDVDMLNNAYALGYKLHHWPLAIRALELRTKRWSHYAADGHLRLGKLFAQKEVNDPVRAQEHFKAGLDAVPEAEKENYRSQVPTPYAERLTTASQAKAP